MNMPFLNVAAAVSLAGGIATGCSSAPAPLAKGALPGGEAQVKIDDKPAATPDSVSWEKMPWFAIVTIGNDTSAVTAYVRNENDLGTDPGQTTTGNFNVKVSC